MRPARPSPDPLPIVLAAVLTALTHLRFVWLDGRLPRDLCLCLGDVPAVADGLVSGRPAAWGGVIAELSTSSGWWNILQATSFLVGGRSADVVQIVDGAWITAVVVLTGWLAARIGGPWAGGIAALLVGAMPGLVIEGRLGWIHVPEAALVLGGFTAWLADPAVERRRTVAMLGLCGALTLTLRPSGLVWGGSLLLPVAWSWRFGGGHRPHLRVVLAAWALAALVPLAELPDYIAGKVMARARYAEVVPDLLPQLTLVLGALPAGLLGLAVPAGLVAAWRRRPSGSSLLGLAMAAVWAAGAAALVLLFRAGLDNHVTALPAFAVLGGWALAAWTPRLGAALAGLVFLVQLVPQWMPTPGPDSTLWRLPGAWRFPVGPTILNYYVPFRAYGSQKVSALLDAACAGRSPCTVAATDGLYLPHGEEPGQLELFYAGERDVALVAVHALPADRLPRVAALVEYVCREADPTQSQRWPQTQGLRDRLVSEQALAPVWAAEVAPGCRMQWLVPGGRVADPAKLPESR